MSIARHHAEWLSLIDVSGPFLSLTVLSSKFPQGLEPHDSEHARLLRRVQEEWDDNQNGPRPDPAIHNQFIKWVLSNSLELDGLIAEGQQIPQTLKSELPEHGETLRPSMILRKSADDPPRLLIKTYPLTQSLSRVVKDRRWKASPDTRMAQLLRDTGVRLGLVTNGHQWMLVDAPPGETTGYASWFSYLWLEEPKTLQAFRTLLGSHRFFGVPDEDTFEALLSQSAADQQDVTDQLGYQVRRAVEVLVQSLDKADRTEGGKLLADVSEVRLYEAALTVMMRLVFLFCAEERELLLLGDELYDDNYAVSTLREQLRKTADEHGEEILERRKDAWSRLLTTFRVVYGGLEHDRLRLPAYGGNLFAPDRFPFLEGRQRDTSWKDTPSQPLPINNRTVLHLLEALQVLQIKIPGGGPAEPRKLSFRALDIEQIGHVYEGLLDHTAVRAVEPVLGLSGSRDHEPEIPLSELEALASKGEMELQTYLKKETGRSSISPIKKLLANKLDDQAVRRFRTACQGDEELWKRIKPFAGLIRTDTFGYPIVILPGSVYVTAGTDRRTSGTHYTPRSLTEPIVKYTLEPLVYEGPAEGKPKEEWKLRSPRELLDLNICDMACGSGAFLVQACRYMSERLLEAWAAEENKGEGKPRITPTGEISKGGPEEQLIPLDDEERLVYARRLVAERCLYGVDINPLAAEMAKLSLWLVTLAKDRPFTFLDHAIKCGDSLLGVTDPRQIETFHLNPERGEVLNYSFVHSSSAAVCKRAMERANEKRQALESFTVNTPQDFARKESLLKEADEAVENLRLLGDLLVAAAFASISDKKTKYDDLITEWVDLVFEGFDEGFPEESRRKKLTELRHQAMQNLNGGKPVGHPDRRPFHWPVEYPEVFMQRRGFDALLGNPPFMGGYRIGLSLGADYRSFIGQFVANEVRGSADLIAFFTLRAARLAKTPATIGVIATNTIAQGDTRMVGLEQLLASDVTIFRSTVAYSWPGTASVEVSIVWLHIGNWNASAILDETKVRKITAYLTEERRVSGNPHRLAENIGKAFKGSTTGCAGFVLSQEEAVSLLSRSSRNSDVLFPFLGGQDFNSNPEMSPTRWVINFHEWSLEKSRKYSECFKIVEERVRPLVESRTGQIHEPDYWKFSDKRLDSYRKIAKLDRVLFHSFTSKHIAFGFVRTGIVYSAPHVVIGLDAWRHFSCLQSDVHAAWVFQYRSTMRTDIRYAPSDLFDTFAFPCFTAAERTLVDEVGESYHSFRSKLMRYHNEGLTKTYNRFHDPDESAEDIAKLRSLHVEMDHAVAAAYDWTDLDLGHGFYETKQGIRYTVSPEARQEILDRLLELNHTRYAEEVRLGLHDKKKAKTSKTRGRGESVQAKPDFFGTSS